MDLDRAQIERTDFTTARRGYDPAAVDAHLREIATAVERLQDRVEELSARPATLSESANERLRRILEAAESSASELRTEAEEEARALVTDAQSEARTMTEEAEHRARERDIESESTSAERLSRVDRRASQLLDRANSIDREADQLVERMREAAIGAVEALRGDVESLRGELEELPGESVPASSDLAPTETGSGRRTESALEPDPFEQEDPEPAAVDDEPLGDEVIPEPHADEPLPEPPEEPTAVSGEVVESDSGPLDDDGPMEDEDTAVATPSDGGTRAAAEPTGAEPDTEGARLIALNMALSGSSRSETADYLRETFGIEDGALLDDVYERVQAT